MGDDVHVAVDALRILSRYQCTRDLVEEFCCARVLPLKADQIWFDVKDEDRYKENGLKGFKGLVIDARRPWEEVLGKSKSAREGLLRVYDEVMVEVEELVGKLGSVEMKQISLALPGRSHVNWVFDLLGIAYGECPVPSNEAEPKKRKRGDAAETVRGGGKPGWENRSLEAAC